MSGQGLRQLLCSSLLPIFVVLYLAHKLSISAGEFCWTPFTNNLPSEGGVGVRDGINGKSIGEFWWCTEQG